MAFVTRTLQLFRCFPAGGGGGGGGQRPDELACLADPVILGVGVVLIAPDSLVHFLLKNLKVT